MGWRYKAGLFLIGTVVIIWVTSAEVTQVCVCFVSCFVFVLEFKVEDLELGTPHLRD